MAVSGELKTMCLTDLFQWVDMTRKSGRLTIESGIHTCEIYFKDGRIITTSSSEPRSYLGQFLLSFSKVTEEQLKDAFEEQERAGLEIHKDIYSKTMLGRLLVDKGVISRQGMERILQLKAEETIYSLFLWEQGIFSFEDGTMPAHELIPLSLEPQIIINKGVRRIEEWKKIRAIFPKSSLTLTIHKEKIPKERQMDRLELSIISLANKGQTIEEMATELHCFEFKVFEILHRFHSEGYVEVGEEKALEATVMVRPEESLQGLLNSTRGMLNDKRYEECLEAARAILQEDPTNREAREILSFSEKELVEDILEHDLPDHAVPFVVSKPDTSRILTSAERYFLGRVLRGGTDVKTLLKLSPLGNYESLRAIRRLREKGLIDLKKSSGNLKKQKSAPQDGERGR